MSIKTSKKRRDQIRKQIDSELEYLERRGGTKKNRRGWHQEKVEFKQEDVKR